MGNLLQGEIETEVFLLIVLEREIKIEIALKKKKGRKTGKRNVTRKRIVLEFVVDPQEKQDLDLQDSILLILKI